MVKQSWLVTVSDEEIRVDYSCSPFSGKTVLAVDGEAFTVKGKPFGIGLCRREMILLGGEQAILDVAKNGRAVLICKEGDVKECKL